MSKIAKEFVAAAVTVAAAYFTFGASLALQVGFAAGAMILGSALQTHELRNQRDAYNAGLQNRTVTRIATDAPRRFVYGRARVGSDVVAMFTSGDHDQYRHIVCVHAAHECDAIEEIYINGQALGALDADGNVTTGVYAAGDSTQWLAEDHSSGASFTLAQTPIWTASNRSVTVKTGTGSNMTQVPVLSVVGNVVTTGLAVGTPCTVAYQVSAGGTPRVRVKKHLGTDTDTADASLMSELPAGTWPSTAVLRGYCYTVIRLDLNQSDFQNGLPQIEALIRGKKLYDFRTGTTAWACNPVLVLYDYLLSPLCGIKASDLPIAQYIAAANVCDDTSVMPQGRYTFNGTITSDQDQIKTIDAIARSMAGTVVATTWAVNAGHYTAPIASLTQSDIVGDLTIMPGISGAAIYNGVKGQFVDVNNNYAVTDYTPYQAAAYRASDGVDYWADITYTFTNDNHAIANLARIFLEEQRNSFTIRAEFSLKAWPLQIGDRVTFTSAYIGQSSAIYRVTDKKFSPLSKIELTLKQDDPSIWDYADAPATILAPASNLGNPWEIKPLTSLTCTSGDSTLLVQADGTVVPRILVQWPLASSQAVVTKGEIEIQYCPLTSDMSWVTTFAPGDATQAYLSPVIAGAVYIIRARCVNSYLNTKSDWITTSYQVVIARAQPTVYQWSATPPAAPTGTATYNWGTASFGAAPSGWSLTVPAAPAGGNVSLYKAVVDVKAISASATTPFDWSTAVVSATSYTPPASMSSTVTLFAFQRSATALTSNPGAVTFSFSTGQITSPTPPNLANGWTTTVPSGTGDLYVVTAQVSATAASVSVPASAWSAPSIMASNGAAGNKYATATVYQWSTAAPSAPTTASTYTWSSGVTSASGSWASTVGSNPGTPGIKLWVAQVAVSDVGTAVTTSVSWSGVTVAAWSANGTNGANGVQSATPTVYQWAVSIPAAPSGSPTYTWASASFGAAPSGWSLTPGTSPSAGYTLWAAKVALTDSSANTTTGFSWSSAAISAVGYAGSNGSPGGAGSDGASYRTGYSAVNGGVGALSISPANYTSSGTSYPPTGTWGESNAWQGTVPSISAGQSLWQIDGIYNPAAGSTVWTAPYLSSIKVGSLSAITTNTGSLNVSGTISSANGNFSVDSSGNLYAASGTFRGDISGATGTFSSGININFGNFQCTSGGYASMYNATLSRCATSNASFPAVASFTASSSGSGTALQATAGSGDAITASGPITASGKVTANGGLYGSATIAVQGSGTSYGGYFTSPSGAGIYCSGYQALQVNGTIVHTAGSGTANFNSVVPNANNSYQLGASGNAWSSCWVTGGVFNGSDERLKYDIRDSDRGRDFIDLLRPRVYKMRVGATEVTLAPEQAGPGIDGLPIPQEAITTTRQGVRDHYGLVTQELREALGTDSAAMWVLADKSDQDSPQFLNYQELIAPMIKAIQELSADLKQVNARLDQAK